MMARFRAVCYNQFIGECVHLALRAVPTGCARTRLLPHQTQGV